MIRCGSCGEKNPARARFCLACAAPLAAVADARETRRIVTVLFADLVGSTAIGEHLDVETFRSIQTRYFAALRGAIEQHGGTVEKYIGDAVMAVFGLPMLHEDDALRAVRAAADLAPALEALNSDLAARHGVSLHLRVGLHTGEVVAGDAAARQAMVSGDTVNTAARLEAAARPDEILLGPLTFELVRDAIAAEALADLALRGREEAITAYRLLAITGTEAHVPRLDTPLVGRGGELIRLRAAFRRSVEGPGCEIVTILAPAGTGKSRLVREFLDSVGPEARIVRGRCLNYGDGITYWALGEILRAAAIVDESDDAATLRAKLVDLVAADTDATRVAGIVASVLGVSQDPASADDIAWAVRRTFTLLARERPLIILIEDIHWAEPTLLDLIESVVDRSQGVPILLLCPARPELLESRSEWAFGRPGASNLHLEPLDGDLASELIDALPGGSSLPADLRLRILQTAEGNPLFVEEFMAMLVDEGHLRRGAEGTWTAATSVEEVPVPPSISLLLAARLDSLDPGDRHVAERASVVGRVFERGAVTELSPVAERGSLGGRLLSLTRHQVIRPDAPGLDGDDAFRFRHVLIRDAAYEALTKSERADLHERFARWLTTAVGERIGEYVAIVAHHLASAVEYWLQLGTLGGAHGERLAADAVSALVRAAERSEQLHAYRDALRHYRAAIHLIESKAPGTPAGDRGDLLSRAAEAAAYEGDATAAITLLQSAIAIAEAEGDSTGCAMLQARLARELFEVGDASGAEDQVRMALSTLPPWADAASRAVVLADVGRLMMIMARFDESLALCEQAVVLAPGDVAPRARARALITIGAVLGQTGRTAEALPRFEEAKQLAVASGDAYELGRYYGNLAIALGASRQMQQAREVSLEGIEAMARFGLERSTGANLRHNLAVDELWGGRPSEARRLILENAEQGGVSIEAASDQIVLGAAEILLGDTEAADAAYAQARTLLRRGGRVDAEADLQWNLADWAAWHGDLDEARTCIHAGRRIVRPADHEFRLLLISTALRIEADAAQRARRSGDDGAVTLAVQEAEACARDADDIRAVANSGTGIWSNRAEAGLMLCDPELRRARGDDDPATWADAATAIAATGVPHLEAYALWRRAEALAGPDASKQALEEAVRLGVGVAVGVHEPVRRKLLALAEAHGIDLEDSGTA